MDFTNNMRRAILLAVIIESILFLNFIIAEIAGLGAHSNYGMITALTQYIGIIVTEPLRNYLKTNWGEVSINIFSHVAVYGVQVVVFVIIIFILNVLHKILKTS